MSGVIMKHDMQRMYPDDISVYESASGSGQNRWLKIQKLKARLSADNPFGSDGNYSLQFFGDDTAHIHLSDTINVSATNQLTLQAWFKPTAYSQCSVVRLVWPEPNWWSINLGTFSDGRPRIAYYIDGSGWHATNATTPIPLNQWSHLAMTYDNGNIKLYVNGAEVASHTVSSPVYLPTGNLDGAYNGGISVGGSVGFGNSIGLVDDAMVTDTIIAPSELGYHASFSPYLEPVKRTNALYQLDDLYDDPYNVGAGQVMDASGNGIHGTEGWSFGSYTLSPDDPFGTDADKSLAVSGSDTIKVYPPASINVNNGGRNAFTYEAWFKPNASGGTISSITYPGDYSIFLGQYANGKVAAGMYQADAGGWVVMMSADAVPVGQWSHIACIYDGCSFSGYLNGQLIGTKHNRTVNFAATQHFMISGGWIFGGFNGLISDVRLTQGALNPSELGYYKSLSSTQEIATSAVATFNMDVLTDGATVSPDSSGNGHDATWLSALEPSDDNPFGATGNNSINLYGSDWYGNMNYGSLGNLDAFSLFNGGLNEFTIEGWIRPRDLYLSTIAEIVWPSGQMVLFGLWDMGNPCLNTYSGGWKTAMATNALPYDEWSHIAGIYKDATLKVYVNGAEVASTYSGVILPNTTPTRVLIGGGGGLGAIVGGLDDVRISNMALPLSELGYNKSFSLADPDQISIADAKKTVDDTAVRCVAYVSAKFGTYFYIEEADRNAGICVVGSDEGLELGQEVSVVGTMDTLSSQERCINASKISALAGTNVIAPLGMSNKAVCGGDIDGQIGAVDSTGLNNVGLLITTTGKVSNSGSGSFNLSDGSGVAVNAVYADTLPADDSYVTVSGISSLNSSGERVVLVTSYETVPVP